MRCVNIGKSGDKFLPDARPLHFVRASVRFSFYIEARMDTNATHTVCRNCGEPLHGEYCARCGQRDRTVVLPVRELVREFGDEVLSWDTRLVRSLRPFLLQPGRLTLEYLAGQRKNFVSPFKLYFFISFIFFFLSSVSESSGKKELRSRFLDEPDSVSVPADDSVQLRIQNEDSPFRMSVSDTVKAASLFGEDFVHGLQAGKKDPRRLFAMMREHLPKVLFLLLPVFALMLKAVYLRSRRLYIEHLVFSFHIHTFIFLMMIFGALVEILLPAALHSVSNVFTATVPFYLVIAMRKVYGQSWPRTVVKFILLSLAQVVVFILSLVIMVIAVVYLYFI